MFSRELIQQQVGETERRYAERDAPRDEALRKIRDRRILDADSPERVALWLDRMQLTRPAAEAVLRESASAARAVVGPAREDADPGLLERILGKSELIGVSFLELGLHRSRSVCRIEVRDSNGSLLGYGTGFLVSPRLLLTNNHVLPEPRVAAASTAQFNFQMGPGTSLMSPNSYELDPDSFFLTDASLDYTLVAVRTKGSPDPVLGSFGWCRLLETQGKAITGVSLNIIQHPNGEPKQVAIRENQLIDVLDQFLHYHTDTAPGSSGAPVFNDFWEVVALHHSGVPARDDQGNYLTWDGQIWEAWMGEHRIHWIANEGVRASRIVKHVKDRSIPSDWRPLRDDMLQLEPSFHPATGFGPEGTPSHPGGRTDVTVIGTGPVGLGSDPRSRSWTIPIRITVSLDGEATAAAEGRGEEEDSTRPDTDERPTPPTDVVVSYRGVADAVAALSDLLRREPPREELARLESALEAGERLDDGALAEFEAELAQALGAMEDEDAAADPDVLTAPRNQLASLLMTSLAQRKQAHARYRPSASGGVEIREAKFDKGDWFGWAMDFLTWVRNRKQFYPIKRPTSAQAQPISNSAKIALFSDWGTALYGAPVLADTIRKQANDFEIIMHLGDVYYSGGEDEIKSRCLSLWPDTNPGSGRGRALNSNHEMYAGGYGYFGTLLPALKQESSYFALQNDHWTLIGLDTGWVDHDLDRQQIDWIFEVMRLGGQRRTLLFSHHQLVSRLEDQGEKLAHALAAKLRAGRFTAWYWGHEHRCLIYDPDPRYGGLLSRCLGHGGIPYKRYDGDNASVERRVGDAVWLRLRSKNLVPGGLLLDGPNRYVRGKEEKYGPHGYMTLEFDGPALTERVHDPEGRVLLENRIT